jgi:14-3-3 protein
LKVLRSQEEQELSEKERYLLHDAYQHMLVARRASWRTILLREQQEESEGNVERVQRTKAFREEVSALSACWTAVAATSLAGQRCLARSAPIWNSVSWTSTARQNADRACVQVTTHFRFAEAVVTCFARRMIRVTACVCRLQAQLHKCQGISAH